VPSALPGDPRGLFSQPLPRFLHLCPILCHRLFPWKSAWWFSWLVRFCKGMHFKKKLLEMVRQRNCFPSSISSLFTQRK
jgi:hypothetical protein